MSYGLQVFSRDDSVNPIFDSLTSFGFVEIHREALTATSGSQTFTSPSVDNNFTSAYAVYIPQQINNPVINNTNLLVENIAFFDVESTLTKVTTGSTATFSVDGQWRGARPNTNDDSGAMTGGYVVIYAG